MQSLEDWLTEPEGMATRLRALRVQAGLSGREFADKHGWAQSKVSRIENGRQMPSVEDIEAWASATDASVETVKELLRMRDDARVAHATFRDRMRRGQTQVQRSYADLIESSHLVRYLEVAYVPGVLQVPDYARRVLEEMIPLHGLEIDDLDDAVAMRLQPQRFLYDPGKTFEFLITEPVLRWLLCSPQVMRAQLDRLQTVIGLDRVRLGIIPMGVPLKWTPQNSVQVFVGEESIATVETLVTETAFRGDEALAFSRAIDLLWEEAATGEDARRLIITAMQTLPLE